MKRIAIILSLVVLLFTVGCSKESMPDYRNDDYGYVQFKLYKEASYGTRAVKGTLDYLAEACKVKVTLGYGQTTIAQTLTLEGVAGQEEFGLRSSKLQLLTGEYRLVAFSLYDTADELVYTGTPAAESTFAGSLFSRPVILGRALYTPAAVRDFIAELLSRPL